MRLLAVPGTTGKEGPIAQALVTELKAVGVPESAIRFDGAETRIPVPTPCGNLIAELPGTVAGPRRMFSTHMDTVPLCAGVKPRRDGMKIVSGGDTALGGDDRTGCALLVSVAEALLNGDTPYPPTTFLFTVREESGLYGARHLDAPSLGPIAMNFNVDGRDPADVTVGAVGADRWEVEIFGKAAHAGVHPEQGVSATLVLAKALADVSAQGFFGRVERGGRSGTSNVGSVGDGKGGPAGEATNVVTDYVHVRGESRSHDPEFFAEITTAYREAFEKAAREVRASDDSTARIEFRSQTDYFPFRLLDDEPVVRHTADCVRQLGLEPTMKATNGGLDANWLVRHGIPTVTIGAGQHDIHTVNEWVDLEEFVKGCELALLLATFNV